MSQDTESRTTSKAIQELGLPEAVFKSLEHKSSPNYKETKELAPHLHSAKETIQRYLRPSPFRRSAWLSDLCQAEVWLKLECLNPTGSFKVRGALNALANRLHFLAHKSPLQPLGNNNQKLKIVAASAGNHAQGVAFAAREMNCEAHIFLPKGTPLIKQEQTKRLGAKIYVKGDGLDEAFQFAFRFAEENEGAEFLHPFNDFDVIAGQSTCILECLEQFEAFAAHPSDKIDRFICSVGGGGLAAGSALGMQLFGKGTVVGVEQQSFDSARNSLKAGAWAPVSRKGHTTLADGIRVRLIGQQNFEIMQKTMSDVHLVSDDDIVYAMTSLVENENLVLEGAGAAPVAHLLKNPDSIRGQSVVLCLSGGNVDPQLFGRVLSRGLGLSGRVMRVTIRISDKPGQLSHALKVLAHTDANLLEVHHDRTYSRASVGDVEVEISAETRDREHQNSVLKALEEAGFMPKRIDAILD